MRDAEPLKREARLVRRLMSPAGRALADAAGRGLNAVPGLPESMLRGIRRFAASRDLRPRTALLLALAVRLALRARAEAIVQTPSGLRFDAIDQSQMVNNLLLLKGGARERCWEPQTSRLLEGLTRPEDRVVVAGANVGVHALMIARRLKPGVGGCHAFEPLERAFRILERNVALNGLAGVLWPVRAALGDRDGAARLRVDGDNSRIVDDGEGGAGAEETAALRSLDSLLADGTIGPVSGVVADIEGRELDMVRGAARLLAVSPLRYLVFEVHRGTEDACPGKTADLLSRAAGLGFELFAVIDDYRGLRRTEDEACALRRVVSPGRPFVLEDPWFNVLAVKGETLEELGRRVRISRA